MERPRRTRRTPGLRRLVRETTLVPGRLVAPLFVKEGIDEPIPIASMPGHAQHTLDSVVKAAREAASAGVGGVLLFGIPSTKDASGSAASDAAGVSQLALRAIRDELSDDVALIADLCMCEYTDHGHCGLLSGGGVDNDATLERYAEIAVAQAEAGADLVAPSGMMDGQVAAIRGALDASGHGSTAVMAYAVKYASAMYGPFRDAAECAPQSGDRSGYQMDPANRREALREARLDEAQGADILMVKPALPYLDVISDVRATTTLPVAAYNVSGEYAMVKAAARLGWLDEERVALETLTSIARAGADIVVTYWATELASVL